MMVNNIIQFSLIILLIGCNNENNPDIKLVKNYSIETKDICYQFYEKFGFTDACEHYRTLYECNNFVPKSSWKKFPIESKDIKKMNNTSNKVDWIIREKFDVRYKKKDAFKDISLKMTEYFRLKKCDYVLDLKNGYYYFDTEQIVLYDDDKKLLYEEVHKCDE